MPSCPRTTVPGTVCKLKHPFYRVCLRVAGASALVWPSERASDTLAHAMRCPYCRHPDSRVVDSREADDGAIIRRRRSCPECGRRFTTTEEAVLAIVKRSGVTEPFSRTKVIAGVRKACQGRPVDEDAIALLAQRVEEAVRAKGAAEVPSHEVGLAILGPLRELDEVAYLRFASVYRSFNTLEDFEREIVSLRSEAGPKAG
jgi:transcriptional repressor NrdR